MLIVRIVGAGWIVPWRRTMVCRVAQVDAVVTRTSADGTSLAGTQALSTVMLGSSTLHYQGRCLVLTSFKLLDPEAVRMRYQRIINPL